MRPLHAVTIVAVVACSSPSETVTLGQPLGTCGPGTHLEGGECVADRFTLLVPKKLHASERPTRIHAFGRALDGSPSTEQIVLGTSRPGAGTYGKPAMTLAPEGSATTFTPCAAATPGCLGPLQLTIALASDPTRKLARVDVELVDAPSVASIQPCSGGGNTLHLESEDLVYPGALTVLDATFTLTGGSKRAIIDIEPTAPIQGTHWTIDFSTVPADVLLTPGIYAANGTGNPTLTIAGESPYASCPVTYPGEFQIHAYSALTSLTASFRQTCNTKEVRGCIHFE